MTSKPATTEKTDRATVDVVLKSVHGGVHDVFPVADLAGPQARFELPRRVARLAGGLMRVDRPLLVATLQLRCCALGVATRREQLNEGLQREGSGDVVGP